MKRPGEIFTFIVLLLFFCTTAFCQSYRKLALNDFKGAINPAHNPDEIAFTSCSIKYSYSTEKENDYYLLTFNIKLVVNKNRSWIDRSKITNKKMLAELLNHEQGHYIIGYLEQQELQTAVSHTVFREDYVEVAKNIFTTINTKYSNLNIEYDTDTQNSTNKAKQHKWDIYFQHQLAEYSDHDTLESIQPNRVNHWKKQVFLKDFKFHQQPVRPIQVRLNVSVGQCPADITQCFPEDQNPRLLSEVCISDDYA